MIFRSGFCTAAKLGFALSFAAVVFFGGWSERIVLAQSTQLPPPLPAPGDPVLRTSVNLVLTDVSVQDSKGRTISGLTRDNFEIRENGKPQRIDYFRAGESPVSLALVVDRSASMRPRWQAAVDSVRQFLGTLRHDEEGTLLTFNETVQVEDPLRPLTASGADWVNMLLNHPPAGQTSLYDAVIAASRSLAHAREDRRVIILISDGMDTTSDATRRNALEQLNASNLILFAIGISGPDDRDADPGTLRKLAEETGGIALFPTSPELLADSLQEIMNDLRARYLLGYYASGDEGKPERRLEIRARSEGKRWKVRARQRYLFRAP